MSVNFDYFKWNAPVDGFVWEKASILRDSFFSTESRDTRDQKEEDFLVVASDKGLAKPPMLPLVQYPTLFRTFAGLERSKAAYRDFANKYGWLGIGQLLEGRNPINAPRSTGEPLWRWRDEHRRLSRVSDALAAIQAKDYKTLREWITVTKEGARLEHQRVGYGWLTVAGGDKTLRPWIWEWAQKAGSERERLLRIAHGWMQHEINDAMSAPRHERSAMVSARILLNHERDAMALHLVPDSLLGAMWYQCARVLTADPTFRQCTHCKQWIELSRDQRRQGTMYCGTNCKVAAWRSRQKRGKNRRGLKPGT